MTERVTTYRMPTLTVQTVRSNSVTFVEAILEVDHPHRIRLETCFDGVVWPPRTDGNVCEGWDSDGITLEASVGKTAVGFATPAVTTDRPIELARSELCETSSAEIERWIGRIEARVEAAESLTTVDSVLAAADEVATIGGLGAVETLAGSIERDRRVAGQISLFPDELCERLEAIEIPTTAFATIAGAERP